MRFAQTHVCPDPRNLLKIVPVTAVGRSASSKTINGAFLTSAGGQFQMTNPPSSSDIFFSVLEQFFASILPTRVDPVNDTFRMSGFVVSSSPVSCKFLSQVMTFSTPSGTPARLASFHKPTSVGQPTSTIAVFVNGVSEGTLITAVHPTANTGPIFLAIIAAGKFQLPWS